MNLKKSLIIKPGENPKEMTHRVKARISFDECYFSINKKDLITRSFVQEMNSCLRTTPSPAITECRKKITGSSVQGGTQEAQFFKCLIMCDEAATVL
jgi:hypothetical protein